MAAHKVYNNPKYKKRSTNIETDAVITKNNLRFFLFYIVCIIS